MVKYLKTRGGEKEFKVEIKNQKIEIIASINNIRKYSSNRFLEYSVLGKNEDESSYAKPLFEDILSSSNFSAIKQSENEKILIENQNIPLNQILYGPPGTGKTYYTIDKALEILGENLESRDEKKAKFDEYVKKGQIVFTTFHQSYGYEEFVEGIKPVMNNKVNSQEIQYEIKDGIFKELCENALNKEQKIHDLIVNNKTNNVWKVSLGEKARKDTENLQKYCFDNNQIRIGWNETIKINNNSSINNFRSMQIGDLVCILDTVKTIKAVGVVKSEVKYSGKEEFEKEYNFDSYEYQTYREVEWILKDKIIDIYKLNNDTNLTLQTVYGLWRISTNDLLEEVKNQIKTTNIETIGDNTNKKFIIIIDEINRGNVSKIFGELITLIEPSKRIGEKEELKVTLPYSGEKFGVPKNVYIIGTMNTADRSITSLDTALRRRFEFIEMMPDVSKLSMDCEGINLQELLKAINTRIEYLLDREKTIGHAFFIGVENLNDLKSIFQNKIISLLQEYFYNDYALINAVLNKNGMLEISVENKDYLKNMTEFIESDKVVYKFSDSNNWSKDTFIKIYE
nr:AAA family ATPase [Campylobacter jejuni]